jgi:hypothetical protein
LAVLAVEALVGLFVVARTPADLQARLLFALVFFFGVTLVVWVRLSLSEVSLAAAPAGAAGAVSGAARHATARPASLAERLAAVPRQFWFGSALVIGLWWIFMRYTRWPSIVKKSQLEYIVTQTAPNTFGEMVSRESLPYWLHWIPMGINLNENNAMGMAFAFLIGGAVAAIVLPNGAIERVRRSRGFSGSLMGGLMGAPLMMCSACSVPVAAGWRQRGAGIETTLGVVGGSALLNIVGLATIWALFPSQMAWARIVASLGMVLVVTPLVGYIVRRGTVEKDDPYAGLPAPIVTVPVEPVPWTRAGVNALRSWWLHSVHIAYRLFLPMVGATFLAAIARLVISPDLTQGYLGGGWQAVVLTAAIGTLIAIPTLFEIPLVMGLMALGMGMGPATALLITAPAMSVVTWFMLRKETGGLAPGLLLAFTFAVGALAGLVVDGVLR